MLKGRRRRRRRRSNREGSKCRFSKERESGSLQGEKGTWKCLSRNLKRRIESEGEEVLKLLKER